MTHTALIAMGGGGAGFCLGFLVLYVSLKYKTQVVREKTEYLILKLPCIGKVRTRFRLQRKGIFMDELEGFRARMKVLAHTIDLELVHQYSERYSINYFGLEGDRADGSWSQGKLAYTTQNRYGRRKYDIFVNPHLDLEQTSRYLSRQLGERIEPSEVQTFLLFHEIGHTSEAGNVNYYAEVMSAAHSNRRWSAARLKELIVLKDDIEQFADRFALAELKKLRRSRNLLSAARRRCGECSQLRTDGNRRQSAIRLPYAWSMWSRKVSGGGYSFDFDCK